MTEKLLRPFHEQRIPVTGFVNEGRAAVFGADGLREVLELWLDAGAELGNHSHSHLSINNVPLAEFTADITRGEPIVRAALEARGRMLRYFRHPFLFTGPTPEIKAGLQAFLDERDYVVAPVTFDNADYMFAAAYTRPEYRERARQEYVPYMEAVVASFEAASLALAGREFPQILLIHANELNADLMPELLAMFRSAATRSSRSSKRSPTTSIGCPRNTSAAAGFRGSIAGRAPKDCRPHPSPSRRRGSAKRGATASMVTSGGRAK